MIGNYYKVAYRNIGKRKLYSFINSFGLSIGIAFCLFIFLFIQDENTFDQFHLNKKDIYLINNKRFDYMAFKNGDKEPFEEEVNQNAKLGEVMLEELAEVQHMTRYVSSINGLMRYREKVFSETFTGVDSGFFKMFSFKQLAGNHSNLFKNNTEIVITPKVAVKYFGEEDPIGKTVTLDLGGESLYTVAAVIDSPPSNSSLSFEILIPVSKIPWFQNTWDSHGNPTFVKLQSGTDLNSFRRNLNQLNQKYTAEASREFRIREKIPDEYEMEELYFTNLTDIHLNTKIKWEKSSDPQYSLILGGIAVFILIIACINYISLALTSSSSRKTEVGIRKISGAAKRQLITQFVMESVVLAFISMIIGLLLVILFLPTFNSFTNRNIFLSPTNWIAFIVLAIILTCFIGVIAGSYPALYLSGLQTSKILKGGLAVKVNTWLAKPLLVIQFSLSAFLIMSSFVMYQQMNFITTKDLGYNEHQVLTIPTHQDLDSKSGAFVENFRASIANDLSITYVAASSIPFTYGTLTLGFKTNGEAKRASMYIVDPYYIPTLEIQLLEGRNFNTLNSSDSKDAIIVNEALVKHMKWSDPLSEHLNWRFEDGLGSKVIGVVKDHHYLSLERPIEPMLLTMDKTFGQYQHMLVRISPIDIPSSIQRLEKAYKALAPDKPFEYSFLDEKVALQYQAYERWMKIMGLAASFAILISCLGLFGLAGTNVVNRTKEICIRKVLGSRLRDIFTLLNKQFILLAIIAYALAIFPSWYIMNKWLNSFQFKIQISWMVFAISMGAGLLVVLITVSYHTVKAICANPAETLKYE
jgi:putative ABC transport system permease protein